MLVGTETKDVVVVGGVKVWTDAGDVKADVVLQWAKNQTRKMGIQIGRDFHVACLEYAEMSRKAADAETPLQHL